MKTVGIGELKHAKRSPGPSGQSLPVRRLHKSVQNPEDGQSKEGQLSVDIYQTDDRMIIVCPIAGVIKSEIKVSIQEDVLTIRGERKALKGLEGKTPLVNELFWGTFSRSIVLPDHIDRKNIQAKVTDHMLEITIPKTEDFKTRIIHINDEE